MSPIRNHESGRSREAFTLIELLVVIATIAMLTAMLVPSLARARESARRGVCGAHLHGLAVALEAYAYDNKKQPPLNVVDGWLDDNHSLYGAGNFEYWYYNNYLIWHAQKNDDSWPKYFGNWANFGLLYANRIAPDIRVYYCPSQRDVQFTFNTPYNPWPPRLETALQPNGFRVNHTKASYARRAELTHVPWDRIPLRRFVLSDVLWDTDTDPKVIGRTHRTGVNVSYRDGHVRYIRGERLTQWAEPLKKWSEVLPATKSLYQWIDRQ